MAENACHIERKRNMNRKNNVKSIILNVIFGVLMLAVLICQFLPFWTTAGVTASLLDVSARQYYERLPLLEAMEENLNGFTYHDVNTQVLLTIVFSALGALMAFMSKNGYLKIAAAAVVFGMGLWLWIGVPAYTLGIMGHIIFGLEIAAFLAGVAVLVDSLLAKKAEKAAA